MADPATILHHSTGTGLASAALLSERRAHRIELGLRSSPQRRGKADRRPDAESRRAERSGSFDETRSIGRKVPDDRG